MTVPTSSSTDTEIAAMAESEASWPPKNFTAEDMLALVGGIAAYDAAGGPVPAVNGRTVMAATERVQCLLTPHLDHATPRNGAVSALLYRTSLGVSDDDVRLALAWLNSASILLLTHDAKGD